MTTLPREYAMEHMEDVADDVLMEGIQQKLDVLCDKAGAPRDWFIPHYGPYVHFRPWFWLYQLLLPWFIGEIACQYINSNVWDFFICAGRPESSLRIMANTYTGRGGPLPPEYFTFWNSFFKSTGTGSKNGPRTTYGLRLTSLKKGGELCRLWPFKKCRGCSTKAGQ